ncbi:MAG: helix-turn-helix transcriptional regulator [Clostridiales bacterium]|nr:helix-turn-helix transcriptional regulator [Clostridiales bacterium]
MREQNKNNIELTAIQARLRDAIMQSGIPQNIIAEKIGVSAQTVSKYMKHDIFPALDTLARLCVLLDVSADEILGINNTFSDKK